MDVAGIKACTIWRFLLTTSFENSLTNEFEKLDKTRFKVSLNKNFIFLCGGVVDVKSTHPVSFRDRFLRFASSAKSPIIDYCVLAENFKDYFKENAYKDLLVFEDEIANISTLILIFLESAGSLVELGMFCSKPNFYKKLIIVAPQKEIEAEDSFIYLGPLEHIRKKDPSSVAIYPWPLPNSEDYEKDHLEDLMSCIENKLKLSPSNVEFDSANSGHLALLIFEIIRLSYPILVGEIELSIIALEINIDESEVYRHIYLLTKLNMISMHQYSSYKYYYPLLPDVKTINFGKSKEDKVSDANKIKMSINNSYIMNKDESSRKRRTAKQQIIEKLGINR